MWEIIEALLPCKSNKLPPDSLRAMGSVTNDPSLITNEFNKFFCAIGSNLSNNIECVANSNPKNYLINKVSNSIYMDSPARNEILTLIMSFKNNKAVGHDNISSFFLKTSRCVITVHRV